MRRVLVDGVLSRCGTQVAAGQLLQQLEAPQPQVKDGGLVLQVVYEDEHMAVVIKPFGMVGVVWRDDDGQHGIAAYGYACMSLAT